MTRINRKQIFARYGIEYRSNNGGQILTPWGDWIAVLMPFDTNTKVGKAATWSTKHGNRVYTVAEIAEFSERVANVMKAIGIDSIKESCPCHCKGCYCDYGFFNMPTTRDGNFIKLIIATVYPNFLRNALLAQIEAFQIKQVRINASGDFAINDEFIKVWCDVAIATQAENAKDDVIFWTYTKEEKALKAFKGIRNIRITPSITPYGINYGTCGYLLNIYHKLTRDGYRVHICCCGTPIEKELNMHCATCWHGCKTVGTECDFVLFIKHSTNDYTAGQYDVEEYNAICEIIRNQQN